MPLIQILIVDDDDINRAFFRNSLRSKGFQTLEASSGAEAIQLCGDGAGRIDLAIVDLVLRDVWGTKVALHIREHCPDVAILLVSGTPLEEWRQNEIAEMKCLGGAVDFLPKPFSLRALVGKVEGLLRLSQALQVNLTNPNGNQIPPPRQH